MRIVIKVGTSTLTYSTGRLNIRRVEELVKVISDIKNAGNEVIFVSSGAIGMGMGKMNLRSRPSDMPSKQAVAAVGQCELMYTYDRLFSKYNHTVAQILLTAEDTDYEQRRENFNNTINRLLDYGVLPVINENDTIATSEISVGDNDTLAAIVAVVTNADLLVLLSDIDGLYTSDPSSNPEAELIKEVDQIDESIISCAGGSVSGLGTGGMSTKIKAAKLVTGHGCDMIITNGDKPEVLYDIMDGKHPGTLFKGSKT